jgi:hypothetical protein
LLAEQVNDAVHKGNAVVKVAVVKVASVAVTEVPDGGRSEVREKKRKS